MFQFDGTFLTKDITEIPADRLSLLSQVVTFTPKERDEIVLQYNDVNVAVLSQIFADYIYIFEGSTNKIDFYYKDPPEIDDQKIIDEMYDNKDQKGLIKATVESAELDTDSFTSIYFNVKNKLYNMSNYGRNQMREIHMINENSYLEHIHKKLNKRIFGDDGLSELMISMEGRISDTNFSMEYLYAKLSKDIAITFVLRHELNPDRLRWNSHKDIIFLVRNGESVCVDWDFDEVFKLIKENYTIWDFNLEPFMKYYDLYNYDTEKYIENPFKLEEMKDLFNWGTNIQRFYQPIHINENLNLKIYLNVTRKNTYHQYLYVLNGKLTSRYEIEKLENANEILEKTRIASAIKEFLESNSSGINPNDGLFYEIGKVKNEMSSGIIFRNDIGFIIDYDKLRRENKQSNYYGKTHYHMIDGYYVRATDDEKKDLLDALELMKKFEQSII